MKIEFLCFFFGNRDEAIVKGKVVKYKPHFRLENITQCADGTDPYF